MPQATPTCANVVEIAALHNRERVFADRADAGGVLAHMLAELRGSRAMVLAIPAGGVPVGAAMADALALPLDVAVVSKITLPWNTEAGFGAVAFDGSVQLNRDLIDRLALGDEEVGRGIERTRQKVMQRVLQFRGPTPLRLDARTPTVVVDDGLASGFTMLVAIEALRKAGAARIVVAVPTGQVDTVRRVAAEVDALHCANVRECRHFAVADAYRTWADVEEATALRLLRQVQQQPRDAPP